MLRLIRFLFHDTACCCDACRAARLFCGIFLHSFLPVCDSNSCAGSLLSGQCAASACQTRMTSVMVQLHLLDGVAALSYVQLHSTHIPTSLRTRRIAEENRVLLGVHCPGTASEAYAPSMHCFLSFTVLALQRKLLHLINAFLLFVHSPNTASEASAFQT